MNWIYRFGKECPVDSRFVKKLFLNLQTRDTLAHVEPIGKALNNDIDNSRE